MNTNLAKDLLCLLPIGTIAFLMVVFLIKRKKKGPSIIPEKQAPIRTVITESSTPSRIVLEYKHHRRVTPAPGPDAMADELLQQNEIFEHEFENWESPFIATPFSKN
jgi:hypothetical protein